MCFCVQYAFLVTSLVQFAGGVVVFFGLLTSPKEVGKRGRGGVCCNVTATRTKVAKSNPFKFWLCVCRKEQKCCEALSLEMSHQSVALGVAVIFI